MTGEAFWTIPGTPTAGGGSAGTELATATLVEEAAPNSFMVNGVQAVYDAESDRTFYCWLGENRDLYAGQFDHSTGSASAPILVAARPAQLAVGDNHGAPSMVMLANGTLLVAWGTPSGGGNVYLARTTSPRDISAWTSSSLSIDVVYPTLVLASTGTLYMFTMPSSNTADLARLLAYESTDGGVTWPVANDIISTSGVASNPITYAFAVGAGIDDLIHISWTVGNHVTYTRTNLYHATLDPTDGTLRSVDGTSLGTSVDASDHPTCLAFTGSNVWSFRQTMTEDRIHIVFHLGTDDGTVDGTYTVRVATWDGAAWSAVDTTAPTRWRWGQHQVLPYRDGLVGLFCEWNGTAQDVTAWVAPDDASVWRKAGTVLPAESGNGYIGVMVPAGDGPFLVMSDQIGADWANDPTSGLGTIAGLFRPPALDGHTHEYEPTGAIADHNTDPDAHPDLAIILPNETVFTPGYSVTDATTLDLAITFVWGIDGIGEPYYNATGVTAGEEAVLVLNNDTGELALRPVEV